MATELPFAYLIDVALVREPTNALSAVGVAVVFLGVACATAARAAPKADTAPLRAARASDDATHPDDDGVGQQARGAGGGWAVGGVGHVGGGGGGGGEPPAPPLTPQRTSSAR
jgi:hypothetical protein